jgi:VIT1/CCC1 family predicted Fe2+/Mn2+ transporter
MNLRGQIEEMFSDYESTAGLADFLEELESNLNDRVASHRRKGMGEQEAEAKALEELGDVSSLANELSLKRKQEVFSEMYMKTRNYITAKRSALYALCGLVLGAAILLPLIVRLESGISAAAISAALPFVMAGILGFIYLGLTQETAAHSPMRPKRALLYVLAVGLILFGAISAVITYAVTQYNTPADGAVEAVGVLLVFALPGIALCVFLGLTEQDRRKPWMVKLHEEYAKKYTSAEFMEQSANPFGSQSRAARFGVLSGALWVAAIAGFIFLTIAAGIKLSWLAIVAAIIIQLLIMAGMMKDVKN